MSQGVRRRVPLSADTTRMAIGTLLSRLTGVARIFALAYVLGVAALSDAYNLANTTPNIIFDLVLGGVLSATLIPVFVDRLSTRSERDAWDAISAVVTLAFVVMLVATVAFAVAAPYLIKVYTVLNHSAADSGETAVATYLLRLFAPQVVFYGLITIATALLNSRERFAAPAFAPILNNVIVILMLLSLAVVEQHPTLAQVRSNTALLLVLGLGTTIGVLVQALALAPSLVAARIHLRWIWDPGHEAVRRIIKLSGWTLGFVVANQVALFIVLVLAEGVGSGTVTAYTYGYVFAQLPYGIIAVSIMSSMQPDLARRWTRGDVVGFSRQTTSSLGAILSATVPAAVGYIVLAKPVVALLLGHGSAHGQTEAIAQALTYLAMGLPGFCAFLFLVRCYQAMQDTKTPFLLYVVENGVNVVLAVALYRVFGIRGLALSLSVGYTVAAVLAFANLRGRVASLDGGRLARILARAFLLSVLMGLVVTAVSTNIGSDHGLGLLLRVIVSVAVGVSVFVTAAGLAAQVRTTPRRTRKT